jgi:novobiocin biosynthesis protein NovU/D-mycarose 3-C-methyltransferase
MSSASESNLRHVQEVANLILEKFDVDQSKSILEIGSNDGSLLANFKNIGCNVLGVDPATNLIAASRQRGIETVPEFFSLAVANEISEAHGLFDVIVGLNVVAHTPDITGVLNGVRKLLRPSGTFLIEVAYVVENVLKGQFDTVYHEHVSCFSLHSLVAACKRAGLMIVDAEKISTQGGSLRVYAQRDQDVAQPNDRVTRLLSEERENGFTDHLVYQTVTRRVEDFRTHLRAIVQQMKEEHGHIVGLGAPARGVVILNYCGLDSEDISYVIDDTPLKQGKMVPGVHIPVVGWDRLSGDSSAAFLVLSWNYVDEIIEKLKCYVPMATLMVPFPELKVEEYGTSQPR